MERPRVIVSYAQSLDGRIATTEGESQWISGSETLELSQQLRASHDGIMVGIGTVLADNPRLTCRIEGANSPHRFVVDSRLNTPLGSHIVTLAREVPTTLFCAANANAKPP